jgi:hypothetical protein
MSVDTEHKRLRRRMQRRLGRRISRAAWELAESERVLSDALDPETREPGEELLFAFFQRLLRVEDARIAAEAARDRRKRRSAELGPDQGPRVEAISRLAADHAAGDEAVLAFRRGVLGRVDPMSAEDAESYLDRPEARGFDHAHRTALLRYQNAHISRDIHVAPGSPLDGLRRLADDLARSYPWQPSQAAAFVLEGLIPLATPFLVSVKLTPQGDRPARSKLTMEVDLWMPASEVLRAYRQARQRALPGHNKPVGDRSIDVVNFVMRSDASTWPARLGQWNDANPGRGYGDYRQLRTAFERASRSLLSPGYDVRVGE